MPSFRTIVTCAIVCSHLTFSAAKDASHKVERDEVAVVENGDLMERIMRLKTVKTGAPLVARQDLANIAPVADPIDPALAPLDDDTDSVDDVASDDASDSGASDSDASEDSDDVSGDMVAVDGTIAPADVPPAVAKAKRAPKAEALAEEDCDGEPKSGFKIKKRQVADGTAIVAIAPEAPVVLGNSTEPNIGMIGTATNSTNLPAKKQKKKKKSKAKAKVLTPVVGTFNPAIAKVGVILPASAADMVVASEPVNQAAEPVSQAAEPVVAQVVDQTTSQEAIAAPAVPLTTSQEPVPEVAAVPPVTADQPVIATAPQVQVDAPSVSLPVVYQTVPGVSFIGYGFDRPTPTFNPRPHRMARMRRSHNKGLAELS